MSGLALLWQLDGREASSADLAPMLAEMRRRGPDGEGTYFDGSLGLGHRLLASTPMTAAEKMPFVHAETRCAITGHIRIDNRLELLEKVPSQGGLHTSGDGELVLHAWLKWGKDCTRHLIGDFAFAIWDPRQRSVFAARDQMGMRQLIYTWQPAQVFACATSARAVVRAPRVSPQLNERRIAEALIGFEHGSLTSTFYHDVFRLPPAHSLLVSDGRLEVSRYWEAEVPSPLRLGKDEEYVEAFREVMSEAVRCRLAGQSGQVGSMLSGGMDSGAVTAVAGKIAGQDFKTFSVIRSDARTCAETQAILRVANYLNLSSRLIDLNEMTRWRDDLEGSFEALEEPFDLHMTLPRLLYLAAQRSGVKVMLDGGAGDIVLGDGSQMARLIRQGQIVRAWRDAVGLSRFWGPESSGAASRLASAFQTAVVPDWIRGTRQVVRRWRPPPVPADGAVDPEFARRVGLQDSLQAAQKMDRTRRMSHAAERIWSWPLSGLTAGRERFDRVASHFGIEPRDPFNDLRVQAFCLGLPKEKLQSGGWPKLILRQAMEGLLPDEVRWRRGKEHLGSTTTQSFLASYDGVVGAVGRAGEMLEGRVDDQFLAAVGAPGGSGNWLERPNDLILAAALFLNHRAN